MSRISLDQAIDAVSQLPLEQQVMLVEIMYKRLVEARRNEIAQDAKASLDAFRQGALRAQSAEEVIAELHQSLAESDE